MSHLIPSSFLSPLYLVRSANHEAAHHATFSGLILLTPYILTYLLTPWSRVLLQKLTGLQLVKKFPAFYGTRRFITAFTSARHLSLSWASLIRSILPHPTSWLFILPLYSHLHLGPLSSLFHSGFPTKPYTRLSPPPSELLTLPISFLSAVHISLPPPPLSSAQIRIFLSTLLS
jgi:hypothetical protein